MKSRKGRQGQERRLYVPQWEPGGMVFSYLPLVSGKEKAADSSYPSSYALSPEPAPPHPQEDTPASLAQMHCFS